MGILKRSKSKHCWFFHELDKILDAQGNGSGTKGCRASLERSGSRLMSRGFGGCASRRGRGATAGRGQRGSSRRGSRKSGARSRCSTCRTQLLSLSLICISLPKEDGDNLHISAGLWAISDSQTFLSGSFWIIRASIPARHFGGLPLETWAIRIQQFISVLVSSFLTYFAKACIICNCLRERLTFILSYWSDKERDIYLVGYMCSSSYLRFACTGRSYGRAGDDLYVVSKGDTEEEKLTLPGQHRLRSEHWQAEQGPKQQW